jgi:tetratricopeptide (TPR) repeat protein
LLAYAVFWCLAISTIAEARIDSVASLIEAEKYQDAIQALQKLASSTKNVEKLGEFYHQLGEIYYTYTHEYPKALRVYDTIIQLGAKGLTPDDRLLGYIKKGDVYCRMGQYEEAIKTYQTLVDASPPTHFAHQTSLQKIRNIQTALEDLRSQQGVISDYEGTPLAIEARFQIAELYRSYYQLNQPEKAIAEYEAILKQYRNTKVAPEAQWRIGGLRDEILNQPALAIEAYQKVANNYPTSTFAADALFQIARIHERQKRYELAIPIFEQLTRAYPDFWDIYAAVYWSGVCYEKLRDYRRAIVAFKTFLYAYLPNLDPVYFGEIGKYNQSPAKVETELKAKLQQLQSDLPKVEWEKIEKLCTEGNYVVALPMAQQLIADVPDSEYAKRAQSELRSIELHAAIQNLQTQIEAQPNTSTAVQAQFRIGKIYERSLQDYRQAIEAYSKLIKENPQSPWTTEALYQSGLIYAYHLNDTGKAIQLYQTLIKQYPASSQTMMANFQLGELYRSLHQYDEALKAYQTTIAYPERNQYLADGYKDSFADRAQFRIGRVHYEDRRYDEAFAAFKEFIESRSHSPRLAAAYVYLARISEGRGVRPDAVEAYGKAMSLIINGSPIQAEMVLDEAQSLGFQGTDATAVIKRLDDLRKRMSGE